MFLHKIFGWSLVAVIFLAGAPAFAQDEEPVPTIEVVEWLVLGPLKASPPHFVEGDEAAILKELLDERMLRGGLQHPVEGGAVEWFGGEAKWRIVHRDTAGTILLNRPDDAGGETGAVAWLTTSPEAARSNGTTIMAQKLCADRGLVPDWP